MEEEVAPSPAGPAPVSVLPVRGAGGRCVGRGCPRHERRACGAGAQAWRPLAAQLLMGQSWLSVAGNPRYAGQLGRAAPQGMPRCC